MKKRIALFMLVAFCFLTTFTKSNTIYTYYCANGRVDIYVTTTVIDPVTHQPRQVTTWLCAGGGCARGDLWWFSITSTGIATAPDWNTHELTPAEYTSLSLMTSNNPPPQSQIDSAAAAYNAVAGNTTYQKWIDPLQIDQTLAASMGIYSDFEIYAPTLGSNPYNNKMVDFNLRSNTGHNIQVTLTNSITGAVVTNISMPMAKGSNYKYFTVDQSVSGTFILSLVAGVNTINRTVIIN